MGESVAALALTEPNRGSDIANIETTAVVASIPVQNPLTTPMASDVGMMSEAWATLDSRTSRHNLKPGLKSNTVPPTNADDGLHDGVEADVETDADDDAGPGRSAGRRADPYSNLQSTSSQSRFQTRQSTESKFAVDRQAIHYSIGQTRTTEQFLVTGQKSWVTNGLTAQYFVVAVRTGGPGALGVSLFVIPRDSPGVVVTPMKVCL